MAKYIIFGGNIKFDKRGGKKEEKKEKKGKKRKKKKKKEKKEKKAVTSKPSACHSFFEVGPAKQASPQRVRISSPKNNIQVGKASMAK